MLEFVLLIMMGGEPQYVGTFLNCEVANAYAAENFIPDLRTICLHQNFINLPKDFKHKYIYVDHNQPSSWVKSKNRGTQSLSVARSQVR